MIFNSLTFLVFLPVVFGSGVLHWRAGFAAEEFLFVCDGYVRVESCDCRERGRVGWIGGGALTEYCGNLL